MIKRVFTRHTITHIDELPSFGAFLDAPTAAKYGFVMTADELDASKNGGFVYQLVHTAVSASGVVPFTVRVLKSFVKIAEIHFDMDVTITADPYTFHFEESGMVPIWKAGFEAALDVCD